MEDRTNIIARRVSDWMSRLPSEMHSRRDLTAHLAYHLLGVLLLTLLAGRIPGLAFALFLAGCVVWDAWRTHTARRGRD